MNMVKCPSCLGVGEYFDGENMVKCTRCDQNHEVPEENEEEFYHELELDNPNFEEYNEEKHSNEADSL